MRTPKTVNQSRQFGEVRLFVGWSKKRARSGRFMMPDRDYRQGGPHTSFCLCRWKGLPVEMQNLSGEKNHSSEGAPMPLSDGRRDEDTFAKCRYVRKSGGLP